MAKGRPLQPLEVSRDTREELASMARSRSLPAGLVSRARIVLLCAEGLDNSAVAERLRVSRQTVGRWRERFRTQGLMGLYDERRPGRPRTIPDDTVMTLLRKTLETRPPDGSTHWTCRSMAAATGVSKSTVQRLWTAFHLQPHRQKHFQLSTDPFFAEKVRDIVGLYLHPPDHALVLCVDNYATHKHARVKRWLADRPRYHIHFTPTYASWLNQVEIWFHLITQKAIRRGSFTSVTQLKARIRHFTDHYNPDARPFVWTATADSILHKIQKLCMAISGTQH